MVVLNFLFNISVVVAQQRFEYTVGTLKWKRVPPSPISGLQQQRASFPNEGDGGHVEGGTYSLSTHCHIDTSMCILCCSLSLLLGLPSVSVSRVNIQLM